MKLFRRPPDGVRALAGTGRVTAWAIAADGSYVVSTVEGVHLPDDQYLRWHEIHKATWANDRLVIVAGEEIEPGVVADVAPVTVRLTEPGALPDDVRKRVTSSVAHSSQHTLPGGGGVRVVARRVAGEDGLTWVLRFDPGTDRSDPAVRLAAERILHGLQG